MGLDADLHATALGDKGSFLEGVFHEHEVFLLRGPPGLDAFVCVDHTNTDFGGGTDGELDVLAVDIRPAKRSMALQCRDRQARLVAGIPDPPRIIEQRYGVKVACLTHQLAPEVDHRFEVLVAHLSRTLNRPFKGFVRAA